MRFSSALARRAARRNWPEGASCRVVRMRREGGREFKVPGSKFKVGEVGWEFKVPGSKFKVGEVGGEFKVPGSRFKVGASIEQYSTVVTSALGWWSCWCSARSKMAWSRSRARRRSRR